MPDFPQVSSATHVDVSAPDIIDEVHRFVTDSSAEVRRAKHSRPRRRYTVEYKGAPTADYRIIRDFMINGRHWIMPFTWFHPTAAEPVFMDNTTPIVVHFTIPHSLIDGQFLGVFSSPNGNARNGFWQITRGGTHTVLLNGSTAGGIGPGTVRIYFPSAIARMPEDTMPGAAKLLGPESGSQGFWSFQISIEELY